MCEHRTRTLETVIARSEATKQSTLPSCGEMDCFASLAMTRGKTPNVRDDNRTPTNHSSAAGLAGAAVRLQAVPDRGVPGAGDRAARGVPDLSARARGLARLHRHHYRPPRGVRRLRELPVSA